MRELTITKLTDEAGYWTANVSSGGVTVACDCEHGSWQTGRDGVRRDVLPHVARALQARVLPIERKRHKDAEAVAA